MAKSLCEILLHNANENNDFLHAVQDEPFTIEELVCEQFAKANPDVQLRGHFLKNFADVYGL